MTKRESKFWKDGTEEKIPAEHLGDVLALTSDIVIVTDLDGHVHHLVTNPNRSGMGCLDHWENRNVRDFLTEESIQKLDINLRSLAAEAESHQVTELNHQDNAEWEFPIRYNMFRTGENDAVLLIGEDLRPLAEVQQQLVKTQQALEKDYEAFRDFDTRYRAVMEATEDAIVFIDAKSGRIEDVNGAAATILGSTRQTLIGMPLVREFEDRRQNEFLDQLNQTAKSDGAEPLRLQGSRRDQELLLAPSAFRAAGQLLMLCRLKSVAPKEQPGAALGSALRSLFNTGPDAIVLTDRNNLIVEANESFLNLVDAADEGAVRGRNFSDYLLRGTVDMKVLTEAAAGSGRMRVYATKVTTTFGSQISAEISGSAIQDRSGPGYAFVIRDTGQFGQAREIEGPISTDKVQNLTELVGSSPLKDIVAATTDVIEKMCIETAVDLTQNNRVAAAEMLGLSRQSLYVKLRKYGLLKRENSE